MRIRYNRRYIIMAIIMIIVIVGLIMVIIKFDDTTYVVCKDICNRAGYTNHKYIGGNVYAGDDKCACDNNGRSVILSYPY